MLELQAAVKNPCNICRIIALAIMSSILPLSHYHGLEYIDFFGLRHYIGEYIPPVVDVTLLFLYTISTWIVCERVIVPYLMRGRSARGGKKREDSRPGC